MVKANHALSNSAQRVKFSRQVSSRKIYDVNLVHSSLLRKHQRLFYGEKLSFENEIVRERDYRSVYFEGRP